jgi:hypothetical protein
VQTVAETVPDLIIGEESEQPDPTITNLEFNNVLEGTATFTAATDPSSGVDGTLAIPSGTTATIALDTTFANIQSGTENLYDLEATVIPTTTGWSAVVNAITTPNFYTIASPGAQRFPAFDVTVPASGGPVNVIFSITRRGATTNNRRFVTYRVQRS